MEELGGRGNREDNVGKYSHSRSWKETKAGESVLGPQKVILHNGSCNCSEHVWEELKPQSQQAKPGVEKGGENALASPFCLQVSSPWCFLLTKLSQNPVDMGAHGVSPSIVHCRKTWGMDLRAHGHKLAQMTQDEVKNVQPYYINDMQLKSTVRYHFRSSHSQPNNYNWWMF